MCRRSSVLPWTKKVSEHVSPVRVEKKKGRQLLLIHPSNLRRPQFSAVIAVSKAPLLLFPPLVEAKWGISGPLAARSTPVFFFSSFYFLPPSHPPLPLHRTTCSRENIDIVSATVLNQAVIVFIGEGGKRITPHELWLFAWE